MKPLIKEVLKEKLWNFVYNFKSVNLYRHQSIVAKPFFDQIELIK